MRVKPRNGTHAAHIRRAQSAHAYSWMLKARPAAPLNASRERKAAQTQRHTVNECAFSTSEQLMRRSERAARLWRARLDES